MNGTWKAATVSHRYENQRDISPSFQQLPHNIEAEQALLGALLINNDAHDRVSDFLKPEHFFEPL
ncbi:DnaB-like helicase N-terminal domain-containing protein, partial [Bartonella alsatica]|uniref:DnaB-like helicase N-terminal domain-containing protein n=1 Tax=Bartonella alsatica TaxID=52764 RepID=UPI002485643C